MKLSKTKLKKLRYYVETLRYEPAKFTTEQAIEKLLAFFDKCNKQIQDKENEQ